MDPEQPLTWDESGKLVPLDKAQLERQLAIAREASVKNPPLADNRVMSDRESLNLVLIDVARLIDACFASDRFSTVVTSILWSSIGIFIVVLVVSRLWPSLITLVALVVAFRLWVWLRLERRI